MSVLLKTRVTAVGPEVADLAEGGVVILFADGAPPELAEVSILHSVEGKPSETTPPVGIGDPDRRCVGQDYRHRRVRLAEGQEISDTWSSRSTARNRLNGPVRFAPSEIDTEELVSALKVGTTITIG